MKDQRFTSGFTVIEVMLFLAITGLMLAGVMVGIGGAIDRERYNDAVTSLHDFLQGQYNYIDNVNTSRPADYSCSASGISEDLISGQPRGTSDCSIVGRLITSENGESITAQPIYATTDIKSIPSDIDNEADLLDAMGLTVAPSIADNQQVYNIAWDTNVYINANESQTAFSLALVRLHTSNLIRSFVVPSYQTNVDDIVDGAAPGSSATICINRDGMVSSPPLGIKLVPLAANANSLQRTVASSGDC